MSQGTGADISEQEANDLLHKWMIEETKVQASFASGARLSAFLQGYLKTTPDGLLAIIDRQYVGAPALLFDPSLALTRKYGDSRAFGGSQQFVNKGAPRLESALVFVFPDGSQLGIWEIAS